MILEFLKSKLILKSIVWNSIDAIVYPALLLLATPVFINTLGAELYGIWMFVNTIVASVGILNAGLGDATIKFMSKYISSDEKDKVHKVIGATYSIYLVLCLLVILVSVIVAISIKSFGLFNLSNQYRLIAYYCVIIAGTTLSLKFIEQVFLAVFKGYDRYDIAAKISIVGKFGVVIINVLLARLNYALPIILLSSCIFTFLFLIVEAYLVTRFSGFNKYYPWFERKYIAEVFSFGIWSWVQSVIGIISGQIDKFIVISLSDIKTFAYYSIALTLFSQIHGCFAASVSWLFPMVAKKIYNNEDVSRLYNQAQFYFLIAACFSLTVFLLSKDQFILWWLGPDTFKASITFINLLIGYNLVMAISIIPTYFLNASGHFKLTTFFTFSNLISRLIFIPLFYYVFQTTGLVIGLIVSGIIVVPFQLGLFSKRVLHINDPLIGTKIIIPALLFFTIYFFNSNIIIAISVFLILAFSYLLVFKMSLESIFNKK